MRDLLDFAVVCRRNARMPGKPPVSMQATTALFAKLTCKGLFASMSMKPSAIPGIGQVHNPDADLRMTYIEQPDGSGHQFMLTDDRQATNPTEGQLSKVRNIDVAPTILGVQPASTVEGKPIDLTGSEK